MFRINPRNKFVTIEKTLKRFNSKNTDSYKPYQLFQQRYKHYHQSSLFPAFLGISSLAIATAGLSYHYNENVREQLQPYLPKKTKIFLDEYIGPNNISRLKKRYADIPGFSFSMPSFWDPMKDKISGFTAAITGSPREPRPIGTDMRPVVQMPLTITDIAEREADRVKRLNEDLAAKVTAQMELLESFSSNVVLQLMEYSSKIEQHSDKLRRAIEDDGTSQPNPWEEVTATNHLQQKAKLKSDSEIRKLESAIEKLQVLIEGARKSTELNENAILATGEKAISDTRYRLQQKQADVERLQFNAQITNQYKELIQQGRERFKQELASLSPSVSNWTKKRSETLSNEDLNALIVHAHRRMHQLQARIAELEAMEVTRLEAALLEQIAKDDKQAAAAIEREVERERERATHERQEETVALAARHEAELKRALTRQAAAHSEHINELLRSQQAEIEKQHDLVVREALVAERGRMRAAIEGWRMRVEGLEAAVEGRADAELLAREAQDLWIACHALHGVLSASGSSGNNGVTPPLARYLLSFQDAAQPASLPVVRAFLDTVPQCASEQGVCTAQLLTKRFDRLKATCKRVAMIEETGAPLAMYIVSWLRSIFMLTPSQLIEADTEIDPVNDVIDTHQIVASAEMAICRQDIDLAVRLLNLLHGMPRAVVHDWIEDARVYLETKLAADALSSYTSSKTAGTIPPVEIEAPLPAAVQAVDL